MKKLILIIGMLFVSQLGFSQITDDSLRSYTNTYIITNAARAITGDMMNTIMIDVIDSKVNVDSASTIRYNADTLFLTYWGYQEDTIILQVAGGYATVELDNLSDVAINDTLLPGVTNSLPLGKISKSWSDLFLGNGSIINWYGDAGHITLTHSGGATTPILTLSHGLTLEAGLQMNATNILTTGYIGRDSDNYLSWDGNDTLKIKIAGTERGIVSISTGVADNDKLVTQGYVNDADDDKANVELDNLSNVAINTALLPATTNTIALGSGTKAWSNAYFGSGGILTWHGDAGNTTLIHSGGALTPILTLNRSLVLEADLQLNEKLVWDNGAEVHNDNTDTLDISETVIKLDGVIATDSIIKSITTNQDVVVNPDGTGVISVLGTTNYENNITHDDDIPNKKYVEKYSDDGTFWSRTGNFVYPKTIGDSVGIGTATPTAALEVVGNAIINGCIIKVDNQSIIDAVGSSDFFGRQSGINNTGSDNSGFGANALHDNSTGGVNSAFGSSALYNNTTGSYNSSFGRASLYSNETGNSNCAFGRESLYSNTSGGNTAMGGRSMQSNTSGLQNVGIGYFSLWANTTEIQNTAIGSNAFELATGFSNATAVGYASEPTASNQVMLGDVNVTEVKSAGNYNGSGLIIGGSMVMTSVSTGAADNDKMVTQGYVDGQIGAQDLQAVTDIGASTTLGITTATLNTGQGANELYAMNQDVETTDDVVFDSLAITTGTEAGYDIINSSELQNSLVGSYYYFDGLNDYINLDLLAAELVNVNNTKGAIMFRGRIHDFLTNNQTIWSFGDTDANELFLFGVSATDYKFTSYIRVVGVIDWHFTSNSIFSEDIIYTIILIQNGSEPVLYVNGILEPITFSVSTDKTSWFYKLTGVDNSRIGCRNYNGVGNSIFANISTSLFQAWTREPTLAEIEQISSWDSDNPPVWYSDIGASNTAITSGTLTIDKAYRITVNTTGVFTNVGAADNNVGTEFIATGTTPTGWGDGNLIHIGNLANYNEGGMSDDYWYDNSGNNNDGTNNGATLIRNEHTVFDALTIDNSGQIINGSDTVPDADAVYDYVNSIVKPPVTNDMVIVSLRDTIQESPTIDTDELGLLNNMVSVTAGAEDNNKFVTQGYVDGKEDTLITQLKTTSYTVLVGDDVIIFTDTDSGNDTCFLPTLYSGKGVWVRRGSMTNDVVINASDLTIDGSTNITDYNITRGEMAVYCVQDGTQWNVISTLTYRAGGLTYISTAGTQTIATGGTFEKLYEGAMAYTGNHLHNFTQSNGRLTYTGVPEIHFTISCNLSVESGETAQIVAFRIAKNGTTIAGTNMTREFTNQNKDSCVGLNWLIELSTNDYIEIYGTSDTNGDVFDINNLTLTVVKH